MEERANRLAHHLAAQRGRRPGDHVGIYALNSVEWVETAWAVFKLRAVWININYRYVEDELRYLFTNADLVALVHQRQFSPRVAALLPELPGTAPRHRDRRRQRGARPAPRRRRLRGGRRRAAHPSATSRPGRATTSTSSTRAGPPACPRAWCGGTKTSSTPSGGGHRRPAPASAWSDPQQMVEKGLAAGGQLTFLPIAPLMHGATQWAVMGQSFVGNRIVLVPKFDPHEVWALVEREKVNMVMITGDAMGKPLIEALDEPGRLLRPVVAHRHHLDGRAVLPVGEGRVLHATSPTWS